MSKIEIGYLYIGDIFYFNNEEYKITGLGNRDQNNVNCVNLKTKKKERFDVCSEVEIKT